MNNGYTLKQYADKYGSSEYVPMPIKFYDGNENPSIYTPSANWSEQSKLILKDLAQMAKALKTVGLRQRTLFSAQMRQVYFLIMKRFTIYLTLDALSWEILIHRNLLMELH